MFIRKVRNKVEISWNNEALPKSENEEFNFVRNRGVEYIDLNIYKEIIVDFCNEFNVRFHFLLPEQTEKNKKNLSKALNIAVPHVSPKERRSYYTGYDHADAKMSTEEIFALAEEYLNNRKIDYVFPGEIGKCNQDEVEVIYLIPEALDPNCVIDPPDVRVWVNTKTKEVTWIDQM